MAFFYPLVRDLFETMWLHGKHIDAVDLEEHLRHMMLRYVDEAGMPGADAMR